jgi:hypothetical protein
MISYLLPKDGPVVDGFDDKEVVYAKNQPQYNPLRVLRSAGREGNVFSRWSPTAKQRKMIAEGSDIYLELLTYHGPLAPSRMFISDDNQFDKWWVERHMLGE